MLGVEHTSAKVCQDKILQIDLVTEAESRLRGKTRRDGGERQKIMGRSTLGNGMLSRRRPSGLSCIDRWNKRPRVEQHC